VGLQLPGFRTPAQKTWTPPSAKKVRLPTPGRNVCVLKDDFRENLNSSNKSRTIVYKQNFIHKLNRAKVKQTATKSYFCPGETDRVSVEVSLKKKRWSLLQKEVFHSGLKPGLRTSAHK